MVQDERINKQNKLKKFYRFLYNHNAYDLYVKNFLLLNSSCKETDEKLIHFIVDSINDYDAYSLISGAFPWSETKEGHNYWYKLHILWEKIS